MKDQMRIEESSVLFAGTDVLNRSGNDEEHVKPTLAPTRTLLGKRAKIGPLNGRSFAYSVRKSGLKLLGGSRMKYMRIWAGLESLDYALSLS